MLLRVAAVLGAVGPSFVALFVPGLPHPLAIALATASAGMLVLALGRRRDLAALGLLLTVAAAMVALSTAALLPLVGGESRPLDLATDAFPEPSPAFAEVEGWYREGWTLDEYALAEGERPDQSKTAPSALVPFVGTTEDVVALRGAIVVARVSPAVARTTTKTKIRGRVHELPDEVRRTLVAVAGAGDGEQVRGVVIDTLDAPRPAEVWTRLAVILLLVGGALGCLWVAARRD